MQHSYEICEATHAVTGEPLWYARKNGERATLNSPSRKAVADWIERDAATPQAGERCY